MKYFSQEWLSGENPDLRTDEVISSYWQHIDALLPDFSKPVAELAKHTNLHDGLIRYVIVDRQAEKFTLALRCGDLQAGYYDIDLMYSNVDFEMMEIFELAILVRNRKTELLYDEVDIADDKKYIHRILFYPYSELFISFGNLEIKKEKRLNREISYEGDPFCTAIGTHSNGILCLEGTKAVPDKYIPCCKAFSAHTSSCIDDIRFEWWSKSSRWVIAISPYSGGGGIAISYCPFCGKRLIN